MVVFFDVVETIIGNNKKCRDKYSLYSENDG